MEGKVAVAKALVHHVIERNKYFLRSGGFMEGTMLLVL